MQKHKNCKSCRHWGEENEPIYDANESRRIFRNCKNPGIINFQRNIDLAGVGAIIQSDSPYPGQARQNLLTHAKFGCRMYSRK